MRLFKFYLDAWYKKWLYYTQVDALSHIRSLKGITVPAEAEIPTYSLHCDVTLTSRDGTDDLDASPALTTHASPSFVPIISDEIRLSQNDNDFCSMMSSRLGERKRVLFAIIGDTILSRSFHGFRQIAMPQSLVPSVRNLRHCTKID